MSRPLALFARRAEDADHRGKHVVEYLVVENADLGNQQVLIGGEQFSRPRVTHHAKRPLLEVGILELDRFSVGLWAAGELTQDPVAATGVGQHDRGAQLALR